MSLQVRATREIDAPPERVFDVAVACETLPSLLQKLGPIPAITAMHLVDGARLATGVQRLVQMSDGTMLREEVLELDRPRRHRYRWLSPPAFPFSLLVRSAEGDWLFTASARGTRVEWTYTFELTSPLARPLALPARALFRRWMAQGLSNLAATV